MFETGVPERALGYADRYPGALNPFWGNYCAVDFAIGNFAAATSANRPTRSLTGEEATPQVGRAFDPLRVTLVTDEHSRHVISALSSRWKGDAVRYHVVSQGIEDFLRLLAEDEAEHVVLSSLSFIALLEREGIRSVLGHLRDGLVKLSLQNMPLDLYCSTREHLLRLFSDFSARPFRPKGFFSLLFGDLLLASIDLLEDVPGRILYNGNVMQVYRENLSLLSSAREPEFQRALRMLPDPASLSRDSHIAERGFVKDSILCSGVEVEGVVERSVLFPNVIVHRKARVTDSVVMNNNRIGPNATIQNALIFPFATEGAKNVATIAEGAMIGGPPSGSRNTDYPDQISEGLTVVGMNAEIPASYRIEPGCYVGPNVTAAMLRKRKVMRRGTSITRDEESHGLPAGDRVPRAKR